MSRRTNARPHRETPGRQPVPQTLSGYLAMQPPVGVPSPGVAAGDVRVDPPLPDYLARDPDVMQLFRDFPPSPVAAADGAADGAAAAPVVVPDRFASLIDGRANGHILDDAQEMIMASNEVANDLFTDAVSALVARGVLRDVGQGGPATHSFLFCPFIWAVMHATNPDIPNAWLTYAGQNDPRTVVAGHNQQEIYASPEWRGAIDQAVFAGAAQTFTDTYAHLVAEVARGEEGAAGEDLVGSSIRSVQPTGPPFLPEQRIFGSREPWRRVREFAQATRGLAPYRGAACMAVHAAAGNSQLDEFFDLMHVVIRTPRVLERVRRVISESFRDDRHAFITIVTGLLFDEEPGPDGSVTMPSQFGDLESRQRIAEALFNTMTEGASQFIQDRVWDFMGWVLALMIPDLTEGADHSETARNLVRSWAFNALTAYTQETPGGSLDPLDIPASFSPPYPRMACSRGVVEGLGFALMRGIPMAVPREEAQAINRPILLDRWFSASLTAQARNPLGLTPEQWATDLDRNIRALPAPDNDPTNSQWTSAVATFNNSQNVRDTFAGGARRRAAAKRRRRTNRHRRRTGRKLTRSTKV